MKKKSPPYAIIVAVIFGIVGIVLLLKWKQGMDATNAAAMAAQKAELEKEIQDAQAKQQPVVEQTPTNMRKVYYATQPVDAGAKISPAFYEEKLTPNDVLPDAYSDGADIVGFYAIRPIEKGDPLTPHNIDRTLPFLSERLPAGMRALALPIFNSQYNNTGSFAVDGDYVDLLFTTFATEGNESAEFNTQTVLQKVQILFMPGPQTRSDLTSGVNPAPAPGEPLSVVFLVTPEEAEMLVHLAGAGKDGRFSMVLRGRNDKQENKVRPYIVNDLTNLKDVQKNTDRSFDRVAQLQKEIEAEEAKEKAAQGNTNETNHPAPPSP